MAGISNAQSEFTSITIQRKFQSKVHFTCRLPKLCVVFQHAFYCHAACVICYKATIDKGNENKERRALGCLGLGFQTKILGENLGLRSGNLQRAVTNITLQLAAKFISFDAYHRFR